jgi:hypothetical protein
MLTGGNQQFTATVQNTTNTGVTWAVGGIPYGSSTVGTIGGTGSTVAYTAPNTTGLHTVTATSVADPTQSATATVTVASVKINISPTAASLLANGTQRLTATIQNTSNTGVSWTVNGILNGNSSVGTVIGTGTTATYTAPATAGSYTLTATSLADTTQSASATVTVTVPGVTVSVTPKKINIEPNGNQQFTATIQNTLNTGVSWTVNGVLDGSPSVGTVSGTGDTVLYTAPTTLGTYTVSATSLADISKVASAAVNVTINPQTFPTSRHVFVVVEENQSFSQVFPSGSATNCSSSGMPYLCSLAAANGVALNFYANTHGSLEDYLFMTSGATWAATPYNCTGNSCASIGVITGDNLVRALTNAGLSWRGYFESMPSQGYMGGDSGAYFIRHNPFPWYSDVAASVTQQNNMYPFTQFATDLQDNNVQNFSFIVPNALDDADDPATANPSALSAAADNWLQTNIAPLLSTPPFQPGGDGILIIVFDEGNVAGESGQTRSDDSCSPTQSTGCGGHAALVMIGPNVLPASTTSNTYQFQDMLYTVLHLLGLTDYMNGAAAGTDIALLPGA